MSESIIDIVDNHDNTIDAKGKAWSGTLRKHSRSTKWNLIISQSSPMECGDCSFCRSKENIYVEMPEFGSFYGDGFVLRIGCLCEGSLNDEGRDCNRTPFTDYNRAISIWNKNQIR